MPTQWSEAEQVPLGCIAPPFYERTPVDFVGGDAHIAPHTAQRCHSEPVTDVTGVGIRSLFMLTAAKGRHQPLPHRGKGAI